MNEVTQQMAEPISRGDVMFAIVLILIVAGLVWGARWWVRRSAKTPELAATDEAKFDAWARARGLGKIADFDLVAAGQSAYMNVKEIEYQAAQKKLAAATRAIEIATQQRDAALAEVAEKRKLLGLVEPTVSGGS